MSDTKKDITEDDLKKLECPFNWNIPDVEIKPEREPNNEHAYKKDDGQPLYELLINFMEVFFYVTINKNSAIILETLEKCDENFKEFQQRNDPEVSINVLDHILKATKCIAFFKLDLKMRSAEIFEKINHMELCTADKKCISTLHGCKGVAWFRLEGREKGKAEIFFREAIKSNPKCHFWHFYLGQKLRDIRRDLKFGTKLGDEEVECFQKAYSLSSNLHIKIWTAQMYRENRCHLEALDIYKEVFHIVSKKTTTETILLRLALGFIQLRDFIKAKECLDRVKDTTRNSMFNHYMANYYLKQGQYEDSEPYFQKAINDNNVGAEKQYLLCKLKNDKSFDIKKHLLSRIDEYKNFPKSQQQRFLLETAFLCWKTDFKIDQALKYFLMAIDIDLKAECLKNFSPEFSKSPTLTKNVYQIVRKDLLNLKIEIRYPEEQ